MRGWISRNHSVSHSDSATSRALMRFWIESANRTVRWFRLGISSFTNSECKTCGTQCGFMLNAYVDLSTKITLHIFKWLFRTPRSENEPINYASLLAHHSEKCFNIPLQVWYLSRCVQSDPSVHKYQIRTMQTNIHETACGYNNITKLVHGEPKLALY